MTTQSMTAPQQGSATMLLGLGAIGLVVSLGIVLFNLMSEGHRAFGTSSQIPWGLPVSTYVFFVLTSTGLTFVASLAMVFGIKGFYPIAKRCIWLAAATLIAGFASLGMEIGHPFRMLWALPLSFQVASAMWWMGVFYTIYLVLLLLKFQRINAGDWDSGASRNLGIASFVSVVLAHGTLGLVFGMMAMRPFWYDGLVPMYFLVTAALSGAAFAILFTYLAYGFSQDNMPAETRALMVGAMPKAFAATIGIAGLFLIFRMISGLWSNLEGLEVFQMIAGSPLFHIELWLGLVVPFVLMTMAGTRNQANIQALAAALVIVGLFIGRYEFVVGGQVVPLFKGLWQQGFVPYTPSLSEWMLTLLAVSVTLFGFGLGEKLFRMADSPRN